METRAETTFDLLDEIYAIAHVLRLLFEVQDVAEVRVTSHAVARLGKMIAANIIRINVTVDEQAAWNNN